MNIVTLKNESRVKINYVSFPFVVVFGSRNVIATTPSPFTFIVAAGNNMEKASPQDLFCNSSKLIQVPHFNRNGRLFNYTLYKLKR